MTVKQGSTITITKKETWKFFLTYKQTFQVSQDSLSINRWLT